MTTSRRLAAIFVADVAGYSRLMSVDEEGTLNRLKAHRQELLDPKIEERRGRIVKTTGDGLLVEFASVVDAVRCAVEVQRGMVDRDVDLPEDCRIRFRIGINLADVIAEGADIFGDGVNIASRLEALAEPGGLCISGTVHDHIGNRLPYLFGDLGERDLKNIARPVHAYSFSTAAIASLPPVFVQKPRKAATDRARQRRTVAHRSAPHLSIVVLPFTNLSGDPEQEYFADAITDDLTTDLSRIQDSFVISRNTAFTYKGKPFHVKRLGRELGVRYVLEGSVRRHAEQVQLNVQLIDAATGAHVWADRFDTYRVDLSKSQNEITSGLANTLHFQLVEAVGRKVDKQYPVNLNARDLLARGWAWFYRPVSAAQLQEAERTFEQALEMDPASVDARAGLATTLLSARVVGVGSWYPSRCEQLLLEALERDSNHVRSLLALGWLRRLQDQHLESRIMLEKAIALDPNLTPAMVQLGFTLLYLGEPKAALRHFQKAIALSPRDPNQHWFHNGLGICHLVMGDLDQAIECLMKARASNPRIYEFPLWLAAAFGLKGESESAIEALVDFHELQPGLTSIAKLRASRDSSWFFDSIPQAAAIVTGLRLAGLPET